MKQILFILLVLWVESLQGQKNHNSILEEHIFQNLLAENKNLKEILFSSDSFIYLDFWASWCGPCKNEIKYAKQLKEQFKDLPIKYVYCSIDDKDQAWKQMIDKLEIKTSGEHWRISSKMAEKLLKHFEIYTIPRFMFLGKGGEIIDTDAPWPSEPYLKKFIIKNTKAQ